MVVMEVAVAELEVETCPLLMLSVMVAGQVGSRRALHFGPRRQPPPVFLRYLRPPAARGQPAPRLNY